MNAVAQLKPVASADDLAQAWIAAKQAEKRANDERVKIEQQIVAMFGQKEEGAATHDLPSGLKIKITGKLSYKCDDIEKLKALCQEMRLEFAPIKVEEKLDETGAKYLRNNEREIWHKLASVITCKPAKTAVAVEI